MTPGLCVLLAEVFFHSVNPLTNIFKTTKPPWLKSLKRNLKLTLQLPRRSHPYPTSSLRNFFPLFSLLVKLVCLSTSFSEKRSWIPTGVQRADLEQPKPLEHRALNLEISNNIISRTLQIAIVTNPNVNTLTFFLKPKRFANLSMSESPGGLVQPQIAKPQPQGFWFATSDVRRRTHLCVPPRSQVRLIVLVWGPHP